MANEGSKQDRELIELLNELRVALPGVQVLFAFLLTVPFTQRYSSITATQRTAYFWAFLAATTACAFLIAPTTMHRMRWRVRDKEALLKTSNVLTLIGTAILAFGMVCVVFLITDVLYGSPTSTWVTIAAAILFAVLWYGLGLMRSLNSSSG